MPNFRSSPPASKKSEGAEHSQYPNGSTMPQTPAVARRKLLNSLPNVLVFGVTFAHVFLSPYTKVEESFTLHAVHDILQYGLAPLYPSDYDHVTFPGAVPRSFFPSIMLGHLAYPLSALGVYTGFIKRKLDVQILIRLVLAALHSAAFNHLQKTIRRKYGPGPRAWFLAISLSQFHIPYYAGRTLPNFMIMPFVLLSISWILRSTFASSPESIRHRQRSQAIAWLTRLATNARLELAAFVIPIALGMVLSRRMSFWQALTSGAEGGFSALRGPIDYLLWKAALPHPSIPTFTQPWQFAWPEAASFHYNVFQGQSANWGIMSTHYYFTSSLPKMLMGAFPLVGLGCAWAVTEGLGVTGSTKGGGAGGKATGSARGLGKAVRELMSLFGWGVVGLVGSMSLVGHKWRFIVYVVPILNIVAALTASSLWTTTTSIKPLIRLGLVGLILANIAGTIGFTFVSSQNYPGGDIEAALERLQAKSNDTVTIHYHSYPLQTGASLFTFSHAESPSGWPFPAFPPAKSPSWIYSKSEDPKINSPEGAWEEGVDYVVTEDWQTYAQHRGGKRWQVAEEISAFAGVRRGGKFLFEPRWGTKTAILRRIKG